MPLPSLVPLLSVFHTPLLIPLPKARKNKAKSHGSSGGGVVEIYKADDVSGSRDASEGRAMRNCIVIVAK